MTSNVGLTTPRGSGTSGYVQRNLSVLRPRDTGYGAPYAPGGQQLKQQQAPHQRQADRDILAHDRAREIEVRVLEFRDRLEEEAGEEGEAGLDEEEMDRRCDELRRRLVEEREEEEAREVKMGGAGGRVGARPGGGGKGLKPHQVHELAEAKIKETERLRRALGIREGKDRNVWEKTPTITDGGLAGTADAAKEDGYRGEMRRSVGADRIIGT